MKVPAFLNHAVLISSLLANFAFAGSVGKEYKTYKEPAPTEEVPLNLFRADSSYTFESEFDGRDNLDEVYSVHSSARYDRRFLLNGTYEHSWYARFGVEYDRFDFGSTNAPTPNHLQNISAIVAVEYLQRGETGFLFESKPGVFFQNDINAGTFDAPTVLALAYPVFGGDSFYLLGGVSLSILREHPAIPFIGALWKISPQWTLRALLPEPKLIYKPSDKLELWVGGELIGGTYKVDRRDTNPSELGGAVVTYYETRAGAGVAWQVCPTASIELAGGYAFERSFDFHRAEKKYDLEGAPYVKLSVHTAF